MDEADSDTDFQARGEESDGEESAEELADDISVQELEQQPRNRSTIIGSNSYSQDTSKLETSLHMYPTNQVSAARSFKRVEMTLPPVLHSEGIPDGRPPPVGSIKHARSQERREGHRAAPSYPCLACNAPHPTGHCPIKLAGVEFCGLCGLAHYGSGLSRNCPHLNSVTQCRAMLETLKSSTESKEHIETAKRYLVGIIARLKKKKKLKEANALQPISTLQPSGPSPGNQTFGPGEITSKGSYAGPYTNGVQMMNENRVGTPSDPILPSMDD